MIVRLRQSEARQRGSRGERGAFGRYSFLGVDIVATLALAGTVCTIRDESGARSFACDDPLVAVGELIPGQEQD